MSKKNDNPDWEKKDSSSNPGEKPKRKRIYKSDGGTPGDAAPRFKKPDQEGPKPFDRSRKPKPGAGSSSTDKRFKRKDDTADRPFARKKSEDGAPERKTPNDRFKKPGADSDKPFSRGKGKFASDKTSSPDSDKRFKRKDDSADRPFSRNKAADSDRPFARNKSSEGDKPYSAPDSDKRFKRKDDSTDRPFSRNKSIEGDRPFARNKNTEGDKPFSRPKGKFSDDKTRPDRASDRFKGQEGSGSKSYGKTRNDESASDRKPSSDRFKRPGDDADRPFSRSKDNVGEGGKRPFESKYKKNEDGSDRPFSRSKDSDAKPPRAGGVRKFDKPDSNDGKSRPPGKSSSLGASKYPKPYEPKPIVRLEPPVKPFPKKDKMDIDDILDMDDEDEDDEAFDEDELDELEEKKFMKGEYKSRKPSIPKPVGETVMPLNKYIAHCGVCSRRDAAALVKEGKVKVNDVVVLDPGTKIQEHDVVMLNDQPLKLQKGLVYVLLNKPKDYITTNDDPQGRKTVMDLVEGAEASRLYPVGRLDRNTSGLLLLTNDGDLAQKLAHPAYNVKKVYQATLDKPLTKADFEKIIEGVELEDGKAIVDVLAYLEKKNELGLEIHSGKNRIVRRIFESLGYEVEKLDRMMYAGLTKKNLPRGRWRYLNEREIVLLKHFKQG